MKKFAVYKLPEYVEWFENESPKSRLQIESRLFKIEEEGHFGNHKDLKGDLWELKFNDGRRIYYILIPENNVLLLLGGNKNGQSKDISYARKILRKAQKT